MVIGEASINNIMGGIENTGTVRLHNHKRKLKQRFVIIKKLGQGTYGKVQLGVNKETGQEVAIKTIKKSKIETEADLIRIRREIQIMSSVQHPNIIHIYEVFENREKMVLVMEYAAGGELYDYLSERKVLVESEARRIFRQIATACFYCHKHKICHRDLKLENILLDEHGNAKIADFGLSNVFDESRLLSTFCGSPLYASPEIVKGTPYIGPEVDCWSLGVLLYTLVYGAMPFDGSNFKRLVRQISAADYSEPARPSPASPLIRDMLAVDPTQRASIERVCAHWWVNEGQDEQCLVQAEALAAQTPVRLDLLLALAPPVVEGMRDKLVVTDIADESAQSKLQEIAQPLPTRSQSVGSIMELTGAGPAILAPAERRIKELLHPEPDGAAPSSPSASTTSSTGTTPKRKHEPSAGTGDSGATAQLQSKQKLAKESTGADVMTGRCADGMELGEEDEEEDGVNRSATKVISATDLEKDIDKASMDVVEDDGKDTQGAACVEILKEQEVKQRVEPTSDLPDKENADSAIKAVSKTPAKKLVKKKVLGDKNTDESNGATVEKKFVKKIVKPKNSTAATNDKNASIKTEQPQPATAATAESTEAVATSSIANGDVTVKKATEKPPEDKEKDAATVKPSPSVARRRSTIFEQAEKLQSMLAPSDSKASNVAPEKPKKIIIPGVSVGGFKREFERKASLTSTSPPKLKTTPSKKLVINDRSASIDKDDEAAKVDEKAVEPKLTSPINNKSFVPSKAKTAVSRTSPQQILSPTTSKPSPTTSASNSTTASQSTSPPTPISSPITATADDAPVTLATLAEGAQHNAEGSGDRASQVKNAVNIISSALEQEGTRKSRSRPCLMQAAGAAGKKPPVPFGIGGRSATCSMAGGGVPTLGGKRELFKMHSIPAPSAPQPTTNVLSNDQPAQQTSIAEITLKSATLPRRKMTKAEIQLDYPQQQQQQPVVSPHMEFRTEMAHLIEAAAAPVSSQQQQQARKMQTQKSEATFPVYGPATKSGLRSVSLEPESHATQQQSPKERIIPISFERTDERRDAISPPDRPPATPRPSFASQKSNISQRANSSLSRQSTLDSESEAICGGGEAIRKSAREYIIPIAVEGGGYVTPRATSLEPQQDAVAGGGSNSTVGGGANSKISFSRRWKSAFSDRDGSEDEDRVGFSPFQRYTSFGKDSDTEDRDPFHMHRLRSSRPYKATLEHTDSVSSGEDDDDDGFEILTAENLFSTLLSRVRDLTQRLKVDDGVGRPGFPTSRLLSQFDHGANFFSNVHPPLTRNSPLGRSFNREHGLSSTSGAHNTAQPHWRRSVSRDLAHDIQSVFGDRAASDAGAVAASNYHPTVTATLPRGDKKTTTLATDGLNLKDFNNQMKKVKLTEEDALALSYLTPGLSRRIQKQLFAQLSCPDGTQNPERSSSSSSTLPRRHAMSQRLPNVDSSHRLTESSSLGKLRYQSGTTSENARSKETTQQAKSQTRRVSRFLRPDFYDNAPTAVTNKTENLLHKEKKEREMETQKVLKEIRDKRIKNRLSIRRERSSDKELTAATSAEVLMGYTNSHQSTENKSSIPTYVNESPIRNNKCDGEAQVIVNKSIADYVNAPSDDGCKKERVSKLMRPKSYPTERTTQSQSAEPTKLSASNKTDRSDLKSQEITRNDSIDSPSTKTKPSKPHQGTTKNKFLQTIERKFEKLRSLNNDSGSTKDDTKKSCVESAIRKLREHSAPKQTEEPITESTLIKRAVSVEDCSNVVQTTNRALLLQPSRKSVTKILGLFKKYEDKEKNRASKQRETTKSPEVISTGVNMLNEISETNIPRPKKMVETLNAKSPEALESTRERPKSLMIDTTKNGTTGHSNGTEGTYKSRLPLINRRSLHIDDNLAANVTNNNASPTTTERIQFSENSIINDIAQRRADQRKHLQLDLNMDNANITRNNNPLLTPDGETASSCTLLSPYDDTVSCSDSWSVCSDQGQGVRPSQRPVTECNGNDVDLNEFGAGESVIDRIRRKSFYSRFNDQRRSRKTSLASCGGTAGSYRDLDLYRYRDYNPPLSSTAQTQERAHKRAYSRSSSTMPDYANTLDRKRDYRQYGRSTSMLHEYVNMPSSSQSSKVHNNALLLSYTRLYHDDCIDSTDGHLSNGGLTVAADVDGIGELANRYKRCDYRSSSRRSVSPTPSVAHHHEQPFNNVANSHLKTSTSTCLYHDNY